MRSKRTAVAPATVDLPPGVTAKDTVCPTWKSKDRLVRDAGDYGRLTFYKTRGFGWVLATLRIRRGRGGYTDRTYGVIVSTGKQCRVGCGPHVERELTVYVRGSRANALAKYLVMYAGGVADSNQIRDRISTRRAQGALYRSRLGRDV